MTIISYLTRIRFEAGALRALPQELEALGVARPLVVTDGGIVQSGLLARLTEVLGTRLGGVFDGTPPNPTEAAAMAALAVYRESGADGVIALGGGSAIDLAKAVRLLTTHEPPLAQYALVEGGGARITARMPPLVAIPTTAGTGSEVGRGSVMVLADGRKLGLVSPHMIPSLALCDPELTYGLPPALTAATGMDAVAHCVETYLSPQVNPPAEAIALDGLTRAVAHLERAVADGRDAEARWNMMMASMEGAMAFQKGLGAVHALSHPLGALPLKLHHGTLNAVLLPAVLRFNAPACGGKLERLAAILGVGDGAAVPDAIAAWNDRLGLPGGLEAMGVPREALADIAAAAPKDHCHATNPRLPSEAEYLALLEESW